MTRASWFAILIVFAVVAVALIDSVRTQTKNVNVVSTVAASSAIDVAIQEGVSIATDDSAGAQIFNRVGALFESRPRRSVDEGDDVGFLVDNHGRQYVRAEIHDPLTAFGEVAVAEMSPEVQLQFPYGLNPRLVSSLTDGSGSASVANSLLTVSTGTTTSSDVILTSVQSAKYQPGQGMLARWTAVFDSSPVAGTEQEIGVGNQEDGFFFAYSGTTFGILHRFAGHLEYQTLTITTGAVTTGGTITINLDGVATALELVNGDSVQAVARAIGAVTFTEFETVVIGDTVVFISHHASNHTGTFSLVDTDTTGTVGAFVETIAGVAPTNTFIAQVDWNADQMNGTNDAGTNPSKMTLVPSNGNVYQVQFQWLGFGDIIFRIENENTGRLHTVHRIAYANNNTAPSIQNPTLPVFVHVDNGSTTEDITLQTSSMSIFTEGQINLAGLNNAAFGTASGDLTTEQAVLCILSKPVFQSQANRVEFQPQRISFSANGAGAAKSTTLRVHLNPILGGDPSFTDVSTATSIMSTDTAGTTLSGGNITALFQFGADVETFTLNLSQDVAPLPPETLVCFGVQIDAGTTEVDIGITWRELF